MTDGDNKAPYEKERQLLWLGVEPREARRITARRPGGGGYVARLTAAEQAQLPRPLIRYHSDYRITEYSQEIQYLWLVNRVAERLYDRGQGLVAEAPVDDPLRGSAYRLEKTPGPHRRAIDVHRHARATVIDDHQPELEERVYRVHYCVDYSKLQRDRRMYDVTDRVCDWIGWTRRQVQAEGERRRDGRRLVDGEWSTLYWHLELEDGDGGDDEPHSHLVLFVAYYVARRRSE